MSDEMFPSNTGDNRHIPYPYKMESICQRKGCGHVYLEHFRARCDKCECNVFIFDDRPKCDVVGCNKKAGFQYESYWNSCRIRKNNDTTHMYPAVWSTNRAMETKKVLCAVHAKEFQRGLEAEERIKKEKMVHPKV
jgi:hypothetical protein